jgi:hypothetical protein
MDSAITRGTIEGRMTAVVTEMPLSPELVLVSPPEVARLARRLLPDPAPAPRPIPAAPRARFSPGVAAFYVFCIANTLAPFALAAAIAR